MYEVLEYTQYREASASGFWLLVFNKGLHLINLVDSTDNTRCWLNFPLRYILRCIFRRNSPCSFFQTRFLTFSRNSKVRSDILLLHTTTSAILPKHVLGPFCCCALIPLVPQPFPTPHSHIPTFPHSRTPALSRSFSLPHSNHHLLGIYTNCSLIPSLSTPQHTHLPPTT